jgi:hypothetical protein
MAYFVRIIRIKAAANPQGKCQAAGYPLKIHKHP